MLKLTTITPPDDLQRLVTEINEAAWDDGNEMAEYDVESLTAYLERQDTVFVVCHAVTDEGRVLMGFASARVELKPYGGERWLYVDEVDVCADQRQRGVGSALMRRLFKIAEASGCQEVWLATEVDNDAANALYRSLEPDDVAEVVGYTYEADASSG